MKLAAAFLLLIPVLVLADDKPIEWPSPALNEAIKAELIRPAIPTTQPAPLIVYLENLNTFRFATEPDESILADYKAQGYLVLTLDYDHNPKAICPEINADVLKLRQDIGDAKHKSLLADEKIDVNHIFIVPAGFRLKRNVEFAQDGSRVLGMDILYPSKPKQTVPVLMEITCDNVDRMGNYSLLFCHDTLLEGAAVSGFAVAMADHPVAPPYKGIDDPMPESLYRMKAAVRTLRSLSGELGLNGKIGVIGFSRGGPFAAMLAVTNNRPELEGDGAHKDVSSSVDAALIHGNRYDYLDLIGTDKMIPRFEKQWGPRGDKWAEHGASYYLKDKAAPMFLNTSNTESPEYQAGLAAFNKRLDAIGSDHTYQVDQDGRGHQVTTDLRTLATIYRFFGQHLSN